MKHRSIVGVVVALHGKETTAGEFFVDDVLEAGLPPQIERPLDLRKFNYVFFLLLSSWLNHIYKQSLTVYIPYCSAEEDKYVVLLSGLCIGSNLANPLQFQLLVDHITGHLGDEEVQFFFTFRFFVIFLSSLIYCLNRNKALQHR